MVHRDDSYRTLGMCDREDEEIVAFQKIDVFAHQPGMIAPLDRDGAQESKQGPGKRGAEEILPGGEIHEGEGRVKNICGKKGGDRD